MPELPEVETLKRSLKPVLVNSKIINAVVRYPKMVLPLPVDTFIEKVSNRKITGVSRRAKMLVIDLDDNHHLLIHLKMTGQLIYAPDYGRQVIGGHPQKEGISDLPKKFTHIWLEFDDGSTLFFNDLRKFGWMRYVDKSELSAEFLKYGIEPLGSLFTLDFFKELPKKYPNRIIKQLLLDHSLVAGIGNIYADESCFDAKILPTRKSGTLTPAEVKQLYGCIKEVLQLAIAKKGTSFRNYVKSDGSRGKMLEWLNVYGRGGGPCKRCGGTVKKIKLNGRGTHFCESCQK